MKRRFVYDADGELLGIIEGEDIKDKGFDPIDWLVKALVLAAKLKREKHIKERIIKTARAKKERIRELEGQNRVQYKTIKGLLRTLRELKGRELGTWVTIRTWL